MNATNFRSKTLLGCVFATTLASAAFNVGAQSSVHSTATANAPPLSLSEAFNIAYRNAPELQAQVANAEAARAMGLSSLELPDPKLKFGIENLPLQGRNQFRLDRDDFTFTRIGFTRDFTHAEKRSLRSARFGIEADKVASVGAERRALIRRELALATVNQHFAARAQELVQALTGEARILVDVLIGQVRTNRARALDAGASQTALRALQDREAEIALQATRAAIILRRWLGDAATRTVLLPSRMDVNDDQLADHLVQHPHLRGAHLEVEAAHKEAQLAAAQTLADWNLEVSYGRRGKPFSDMVSAFVTVDLPSLGEARINAEVLAKKRNADAAGFALEEQRRQVDQELRLQLADYHSALTRAALFDRNLVPLTEEIAAIALAAYRGGQGLLTEALDARRKVLEVNLLRLQQEADAARAWAQLVYYMPEGSVQ